MQKKLVQSSLALSAAALLSLGSAFVAGPAAAAPSQAADVKTDDVKALNVQSEKQVSKAVAEVDGVNAYGVRGDELNLGVEDPNSKEAKDLAAKYENVNVVKAAKNIQPHANNDLVGGAGYLMDSQFGGGACSTGFAGWNKAGDPIVLTAGHCAEAIDETTNQTVGETTHADTEQPATAPANGGEGFTPQGTGPMGEWGFHKFGSDVLEGNDPAQWPTPKADDIDFAEVKVDAKAYAAKNGITDWTSADSNDLSTSVNEITEIGAHTDAEVSKAGRTTGVTTGDVFTEYNEQFDFQNIGGRWVHGFAVLSPIAEPFSQPGDSGGGVYQGNTAVGVISGGGEYDATQQFGWVADLDYSLEQSGVDFQLTDPSETPEAPEAPTAEDQTIKPNGDVKGKAVAGADVKIDWKPAAGAQSKKQAASEGSETVKADADGNFVIEGPETPGEYDYTATATVDGQTSEAANFVVTVEEEAETPPPAERGIVVEPKEIVAADFVQQDKGVTITVEGFDEGEEVTLEVVAGPENVQGIELNEVANAEGVAAFSVYGTNANDPSVYVGKYDVSVTGANDTADEKALAGSFEVVADEDGSGGGDGGGSDLPKTGAEMTGLAAGVGLLVVGGAAVVLTMRRAKKN